MPTVTAIGETVFDIIIKNGSPLSANPGGSVLNTAISLGRLGVHTRFITELGTDTPSKHVKEFLIDNNIDIRNICEYKSRQTAVALAYLDDNNNASYTFYKDYPNERLNIQIPTFEPDGFFLFASSMAINEQVRTKIRSFAQAADLAGCAIYYDPNYRPKATQNEQAIKALMLENMRLSHIVRGSSEDFEFLFGHTRLPDIWQQINNNHLSLLICTHAADGVSCMRSNEVFTFDVPQLNPISTVGAGDNFNAGILYSLATHNITRNEIQNMSYESVRNMIDFASSCSAHVCGTLDNYISQDFALALKNN